MEKSVQTQVDTQTQTAEELGTQEEATQTQVDAQTQTAEATQNTEDKVDNDASDYTYQVISFDVGLRHFAYCVLDVAPALSKRAIRHLDVVDLGCKKGNPQKVVDCVIDVLDHITYNMLDTNKKTVVLIECQMTAVMKCVQTVINAYFKITSKYSSMDAETFYLSAKHKLSLVHRYKDYPKASESLVPISNPKNAKVIKYKKNKLDSVHFALWLLANKELDMTAHDKVLGLRKKDDVTDALLMAIYHIESVMYKT